MSSAYKITNPEGMYYLTATVLGWIDVFTRQQYRDIILDSIKYCQDNRGLQLHAWVIMSNHMHLIASSEKGDLSGIMRDMKKHTSKKIVTDIKANEQESRKEWMLSMFSNAGKYNNDNEEYQFWRKGNQPKELETHEFAMQKLNYIHNNPVRAGIVEEPEHYLYSSARDYAGVKGLLDVVFLT